MSKLLPFQISNFAHTLHLFQVMSKELQTRISWSMSVRKAASWYNSLL